MASCNGNSSGSNKAQQSANTTQPSVPGETTIVYVRNDSLLTNYTLFKELSEEMLKKEENARATLNEQQRDLEQDAMDFQRKLQNNAFATQQRAEEENARLMKKQGELQAKNLGLNESKVKSYIGTKVQREIKGQTPDGFYLKVKAMLDECGEVSDAIGRLTDKDYYATLSYEEKQRYNLELSARYLEALERYRKEKEMQI